MRLSPSKRNIILIGMAGAGKSTVGQRLAHKLGAQFTDTDHLIASAQQASLQKLVERDGYMALRQYEEQALLEINQDNSVIATGGSAIYSKLGMRHLQELGTIVWLELDYPAIAQRVADASDRGLAKPKNQTLTELFAERQPLYAAYADITINTNNKSVAQTCTEIIMAVNPSDGS